MLGYRLDIVPSSPFVLDDVDLDSNNLSSTSVVTKDVYSSLALFGAAGNGDLAHLVSNDGAPVAAASILGLTQVWVRDTVVLSGNGAVSGITNNYTQAVPEIDASSLAGAFPLLVGGLALLERRRRRGGEQAASTGC